MGVTTIEWTSSRKPDGTIVPGYSWSPWWGCVEVSPACDNCYARELAKRYGHQVWGKDAERRELSDAHWKQPLIWNRKAEREGVRYRVFPSMCDPFEYRFGDSTLDICRARFWDLIDATPSIDWLLLTKRPENIRRMIPDRWSVSMPRNAQIGATVEDRPRMWRIESLRRVKAHVRFLSIEPLLEDLGVLNLDGIHQVIVGGESGHSARPMHPDWARSIRDQCIAAGVAYHFKQWGEYQPLTRIDGVQEMPFGNYDTASRFGFIRKGKKKAGRILDGRTWDEMPGVTHA